MNAAQANLFGEPITFGRSVDHAQLRQAAIERAQRNQSDAFLTEYRNFVLRYAETHGTFSNEDIRREYEKTKLPRPISLKSNRLEWRGAGFTIQQLVKSGHLVCVGTKISKTRRSDIKVFRKG